MNIRQVLRFLCFIMLFLAAFLLLPIAIALFNGERQALFAFLTTALIMGSVSGFGILVLRQSKSPSFTDRDGFLFTTATWIFAAAFYSLPFMLTDTIPTFSQSFFEVMSGITTTGASMIDDVESCYRSILMFRAMINWLGGMGIVVLFVAFLPAISSSGGTLNLINAETVGPVKGKLTSKTRTTAIILWAIYIVLTIVEIILLLFGHLSLYEAVTVAFSTLSTAGFSIKNASVGGFNSAYVDVVVTVFMVVAAVNFTNYHRIISGRIRDVFHDTELKVFLSIFFGCTLLGGLKLFTSHTYPTIGTSLRYMAFHIASVVSTTGFATADFTAWPSLCVMLVIAMMFIGGCAGSTGGGPKIARLTILAKSAGNSLRKKIHPQAVMRVTLGDEIVSEKTHSEIQNFFFMYMLTWLVGAVLVSFSGAGIMDCLSASILTLGNIGLGFGKQLFSTYPLWLDWVFSFLMLIGRLEIFTVYVLFTRAFWKR